MLWACTELAGTVCQAWVQVDELQGRPSAADAAALYAAGFALVLVPPLIVWVGAVVSRAIRGAFIGG